MELKQLARRIVRLGDLVPSSSDVESAVRLVLRRELRLNDVQLEDDLIELDPDFPTEEIVKDVAEEFGQRLKSPHLDDWTGSLADLVRVIQRQLAKERSDAPE